MADYFDEIFEADCPKYVDFTVPQDLEDNADEWFNYDHENGIPVNFEDDNSDQSKMDIGVPNPKDDDTVTQLTGSTKVIPLTPSPSSKDDDEYSTPLTISDLTNTVAQSPATTPKQKEQEQPQPEEEAKESTTENRAPTAPQVLVVSKVSEGASTDSPAPPLQEKTTLPAISKISEVTSTDVPAPAVQEKSTLPVVSKINEVELTDSPAPPLQEKSTVSSSNAAVAPPKEATDSPALPLQQKPVAMVSALQTSLKQDNLELIPVSAENTPKDSKTAPAEVSKPEASNIVTHWSDDEEKKEDNASSRPSRQTKRAPVKKQETKSTFNRSNSLRRSTRRSAVADVVSARGQSQTVKRRKSLSLAPLHKRRSAPQTNTVPTKRTPTVDAAKKRRSAPRVAAPINRAPSADSLTRKRRSSPRVSNTSAIERSSAGKRKRTNSTPSNARKSPRLQTKPTLTMPHTPNCLRRNIIQPGQSKFKSSEELELERIAQKKAEAQKAIALSRKSYQMAQESVTYHPTRSSQEPTRPLEFRFETDTRLKSHGMETRQDRDMKDFAGALRKHPRSPSKPRGPTVQKPFLFTGSRKRHNEDADTSGVSTKYKPMALQIREFHRRTPERFRTKVANDIAAKGHNPVKAVHSAPKPILTCPKTPNLETRSRKRPVTAISAAEREEMEVLEMKSYTFRAQPVDPRVMNNLNLGVMKPIHKSPTKFVNFNLECEKRFKEREANRPDEEEEKHEFHAQELNPRMFEGTLGVAPAKPIPLTCPKSPAFALKNRVRSVRTSPPPEEKEISRIVHANPVPHNGIPFMPNLKQKVTEAKPFSFDERDKDKKAMKEAKISKMLEEEQASGQFKAQPIPNHDLIKLPEKKVRRSTRPEPFLSVEERATRQAEEWSKKMEEELKEQRQQASSFRAKPADVLYEDPFIPMKSNKALTEVSDFELNSERRAVARQGYEEHKHARDAELRAAAQERERLEAEEERQAVERLRQEMVHKPNPIRNFRPVEIMPSTRPLTQPESPNFATDARLRNQPRL